MTICPGLSPCHGMGCLLAQGHEYRGQPTCRNQGISWCSLCDQWGCNHVSRDARFATITARLKRGEEMRRWHSNS